MTKIPHCALQVYLVLPRAAAVAWGRGSVSLTQAAASQSDSELKLELRPLQLQALHSATRMYTYIILPRSAALSRRMVTAFAGTTRALALSAPLQHPVSATTRFVLLPDSTVLHQGVLSTCSPVQGVGGENGGGWLGAGRPRYFVGLENGASDRHSVPHY